MQGASSESEAVGTVGQALAHAHALLERRPRLAAEQAREILAAVPDEPRALAVLGAALRRSGDAERADGVLRRAVARAPDHAFAQFEFAQAALARGETGSAREALRRAAALDPERAETWRALGDLLLAEGDTAGAEAAYLAQIRASTRDPELLAAADDLGAGRLAFAERTLRDRLMRAPTDVAAIRMLAEVGTRLGRYGDVEKLLTRALELAPAFTPARHNLAVVLYRQGKADAALVHLDRLLEGAPGDAGYRNLRAAALGRIGDNEEAARLFGDLVAEHPANSKLRMSHGHALKTAGRHAESVEAYRAGARLDPGFGEVWWSLANLKTYRFTADEIAAMRGALDRPGLSEDDRLHLHFALGKAQEDAGAWAGSFADYAAGAALRRGQLTYSAQETTDFTDRAVAVLTPAFMAARAGGGEPAPDPIFVVGLPRSGSTLVEQILASHSQVEGTQELPDINSIALRLGGKRKAGDPTLYPEILAELDQEQRAALGREFLERTRVQRKTNRPLFIDKMPNNFQHVGLIRLILPNAKIIDTRRDAMGTCFSGFKQHFARGQSFTYDLDELGRYYRDYVRLMDHYDRAMPGAVHRVIYECMVEDQERETRRLLDYCGLPFEEGCLRFHENTRAVRTASSEQVRRPIFRDALEQWRHYEPWLGPLKQALGPELAADDPPTDAGAESLRQSEGC